MPKITTMISVARAKREKKKTLKTNAYQVVTMFKAVFKVFCMY